MLKGSALRNLGRYEEAVAYGRQACQYSNTGFAPPLLLAASLSAAGQISEAKKAIATARELEPSISITYVQKIFTGVDEAVAKRFYGCLRKAGLPE